MNKLKNSKSQSNMEFQKARRGLKKFGMTAKFDQM